MPAVSEKQQRFMGAELARKRAGKKTRTGMSEKQLSEYAGKVHVPGGSMHGVLEVDGDGGGEDMMYESDVMYFGNPGEACGPMDMMEKRA